MEKKYITFSRDAEKALYKIQHPLYIFFLLSKIPSRNRGSTAELMYCNY